MRLKISKIIPNRNSSQVVELGNRDSVGYGYLIIPNDIERSEYINKVYRTGLCMIVTPYQQVIKNVNISINLLPKLSFPEVAGEYGSLISWCCEPKTENLIITGLHLGPEQMVHFKEHCDPDVMETDLGSVAIIKDAERCTVDILTNNKDAQYGAITLKTRGQSKGVVCVVGNDGNVSLEADDSIDVVAENQIKVQLTDNVTLTINKQQLIITDQFDNKVLINEEGVLIESAAIILGEEGVESGVLGDQLQQQLNTLNNRVNTLYTAISAAPTIPADGGSTFKAALVAAIQALPQAEFSQILSDVVKLK